MVLVQKIKRHCINRLEEPHALYLQRHLGVLKLILFSRRGGRHRS